MTETARYRAYIDLLVQRLDMAMRERAALTKQLDAQVIATHVADRKAQAAQRGIILCPICCENPRDRIFSPCSHIVSCHTCAPSLSSCPICRAPIATATPAFLA
jgi:hypothetical protein